MELSHTSETEEFYNRLVTSLNTQRVEIVVEQFFTLKSKTSRIVVLANLAYDLANAVAAIRDDALMSDAARTRDLGLVRDLDHALAHTRALASDLAGDLEIDLDRDLSRTRDLDMILVRIRARARELAGEIDRLRRHNRFIVRVLEVELGVVERDAAASVSAALFSISGLNEFTPTSLTSDLAPYLQAIADLQRIISEITGEGLRVPRITLISQSDQITVSMNGVEDAIYTISQVIAPWRQQRGRHLTDQLRIELALAIISRFAEDVPDNNRMMFVNKLSNPLNRLVESSLELEVNQ